MEESLTTLAPSNGTELSDPSPYPELNTSGVAQASVLLFIFTFSVLCNLRALHHLVTGRCHPGRRCSSLLVLHLIIADLLVTGLCLLGNSAWILSVQFHGGDALCRAFKFGQSAALNCSTYVTTVIAIDRAGSILTPWRWNRRRALAWLLTAAWLLGLAVSAPQLVYFGLARGPWSQDFYQCVSMEMRPLGILAPHIDRITVLYMVYNFLSQFLIPVCCMSVCYARIICRITTHLRHLSRSQAQARTLMAASAACRCCQPGRRRRPFLSQARTRSSRMFSAMVLAFGLLWLPYWLLYATACINRLSRGRHDAAVESLSGCVFFFGMSVSAVNPVIYGAFRNNAATWGGCGRRGEGRHCRPLPQQLEIPLQRGAGSDLEATL